MMPAVLGSRFSLRNPPFFYCWDGVLPGVRGRAQAEWLRCDRGLVEWDIGEVGTDEEIC